MILYQDLVNPPLGVLEENISLESCVKKFSFLLLPVAFPSFLLFSYIDNNDCHDDATIVPRTLSLSLSLSLSPLPFLWHRQYKEGRYATLQDSFLIHHQP
jgi:hypothetical protein